MVKKAGKQYGEPLDPQPHVAQLHPPSCLDARAYPLVGASGGSEMESLPDYDVALFVVPAEAYQWIISRLQRQHDTSVNGSARDKVWRARHHGSQTTPADQVLGLTGEHGAGKTWILRHLAENDHRVSPLAVYLDLEQRTTFSGPEIYVDSVERQINERCGDARAILLLDGVPASLDDYLRALESEILKPQLIQRGSLVIMALVQPSRVCWRIPVLRGGEHYLIPPFTRSQTLDQVQRLRKQGLTQNGVKANNIHKSSGGLPLLNHLLATREQDEAFVLLLESWIHRVPIDEREPVRTYVQAVCALDVLEHLKMQRLLDLYYLYRPDERGLPAHAAKARGVLQRYGLAQTMPDSPGHIALVDSVRRAARGVLQVEDRGLYAELEKAARAPETK